MDPAATISRRHLLSRISVSLRCLAHGYYRQLQSFEIEIANLQERVESIELSIDGQSRSKHHVRPTVSSAEGGTVRGGHDRTKECSVAFDQNTPTVLVVVIL